MKGQRIEVINLIKDACNDGASQKAACDIIGISTKTLQRWHNSTDNQDKRLEPKHTPKHKFTEFEKQRIIELLNKEEYAFTPPS